MLISMHDPSSDMIDIHSACNVTDDIVTSVYPEGVTDYKERVILMPKNDMTLHLKESF